jgi:hypothetical protein
VFDAMFTHDMEETRKSKVNIVDLDSDTVQDMIIYIYSGRVSLLSVVYKYIGKHLSRSPGRGVQPMSFLGGGVI